MSACARLERDSFVTLVGDDSVEEDVERRLLLKSSESLIELAEEAAKPLPTTEDEGSCCW